jgi:hypothetical protein
LPAEARSAKVGQVGSLEEAGMAEFSFVAPILPGKTQAWRDAVAQLKGPRSAEYRASRARFGIVQEHVCLQSTPMGDMVVVHMVGPEQSVFGDMFASTDPFDQWFKNTVLIGAHGMDPGGAPPPPIEVILDTKL